MNLELKALYNAEKRIAVRLPHYVEAADVTCTATLPSGATVSPTVTSASEDTYSVTEVGSDRRTLTIDAGTPTLAGLVGEDGGTAFWFDAQLGEIPLRIVERPTSTQIVLADPVPGKATSGTITYGTLWVVFTVASGVTSAVQRVPFIISYTYDQPGGLLGLQGSVTGLIHVVKYPFATGLTTDALVTYSPQIRSRMPVQQGSYQRAIDASERVLWRWLRQDLRGREEGKRTEDSVSGSAFHEPHALLTLAHIEQANELVGGRQGLAEGLRTRAREIYDQIMQSVPFIDTDGDGVPDASELDTAAKGPTATVGGLYTTSSFVDAAGVAYENRFRVGARH